MKKIIIFFILFLLFFPIQYLSAQGIVLNEAHVALIDESDHNSLESFLFGAFLGYIAGRIIGTTYNNYGHSLDLIPKLLFTYIKTKCLIMLVKQSSKLLKKVNITHDKQAMQTGTLVGELITCVSYIYL